MDLSISNFQADLEELIRKLMGRMNTAIPGVIDSFDPSTQTCSVTPAIQMRVTDENGTQSFHNLPKLTQVPVLFPNAGGFYITLPVKAGDNCLLIFSQRAIDNWHASGGIQPPENNAVISRSHHMTDAFAILAPLPLPDAISDYDSACIVIRNMDNSTKITVSDDDATIVKNTNSITVSSVGITIEGNVLLKGNLTLETGKTIKGSAGIDLLAHRHADPQGGTTGVPIS